jgi:hypothetical protein
MKTLTVDLKKMYDEKRIYVELYIKPTLKAARLDVVNVSYRLRGPLEVMTIEYDGGHKDRVNVTGNSLEAILKEAVREATGHNAVGHMRERDPDA